MAERPSDRKRWQRVEAILDQALEVEAEERPAFLETACAGDTELRAEVEELLAADRDSDSFLRGAAADHAADPLSAAAESTATFPTVDAGEDRRIGPYRLLGRIGAGGMGVVYEAEDTRLHRRVAIKFLPPEFSRDPGAKERFRREARAASRLDHPGICTIHDIGESEDGRLYFVMAFYRGETLKTRLEGGPIPIGEARRIAIQIARGLRHAHEAGIVHRDIKPANVILTEDGQAKLLDFGIARIGDAAALTRTGTSLGTPGYMSPEQTRGEPTDARSDLWSLGVLLYEMLAGRRPFVGDDPLAVMNAIIRSEPPPIAELREEVPDALAATVGKLLAKDPDDRYPSAAELLADLETETALDQLATPPAGRSRRRIVAGVAAVLVLALLTLAIPASRRLLFGPRDGPTVSGPRLVAVLPFFNSLEATPENQALADGLTHSLTGLIARLGSGGNELWIVPSSEIVRQDVISAADAHRLFGVDTVLTGSVQRLGETTEIVVSVIDPTVSPPRTVDSGTVTAPIRPELRAAALRELADLLAVSGGGGLAAGDDPPTTATAYTLYLQGVGYLQRFDKPGNLEAAIAAFDAALADDPLYGAAHAARCEALWDKHRQTDDPELATAALAACDRAAELGAGQASVLVSVGRSFYQQGELRKARAELERAIELEPDNAEAHRWLGWVASEEGRAEEAEEAFRAAIDLEPRLWVYYNDLGIALSGEGRHEEAVRLFEESRRLTPENHLAYNALAVARTNLGETAEAERLYRRSIELQPSPLAYRNLGHLYFRDQRYDEAVEALEKARDLHREAPSFNDWITWSWLAHAYYWSGDRDAAEKAWRRLIEIATPLYEVNPKNADALMLLADAWVALGDLERARYYQGRLLALPIDIAYLPYYIGRTYELMGDRELALSYITRALEEGFDPLMVDRDPWLEDLRTDSSYQALRRQYLPSGR